MRNLCRTPRTRNSAKSSTMPKRTSPFSSRLAGAIGIAGTAPSWGATALYTYATAASLRAHGLLPRRVPETASARPSSDPCDAVSRWRLLHVWARRQPAHVIAQCHSRGCNQPPSRPTGRPSTMPVRWQPARTDSTHPHAAPLALSRSLLRHSGRSAPGCGGWGDPPSRDRPDRRRPGACEGTRGSRVARKKSSLQNSCNPPQTQTQPARGLCGSGTGVRLLIADAVFSKS